MNKKNKNYLVLCVFGGWLGLHHFYNNNFKLGLLYLFTLGIFGFGWITDIILAFKNLKQSSNNKQNNSNYVNNHTIFVKPLKSKVDKLYIGQFVNIDVNYDDNNDFIEDENYFLYSHQNGKISFKIAEKEKTYCENYEYGIIKSISYEQLEVVLLCCDGYLQIYNISTNIILQNGDSFIIRDGNLISENKVVGKIIDNRYKSEQKIILNSFEDGKLVVFIQK